MSHQKAMAIIQQNPFSRYISRADMPDVIDLPRPRLEAEERIRRLVEMTRQTKIPKVLPILGEAGLGKTHFYWTLHSRLSDVLLVYVPPPTTPNSIMANFYFSIIRAHGKFLLKNAAEQVVSRYGSIENALHSYAGSCANMIEALFVLQTDPSLSKYALRWLTGLEIDQDSLKISKTIMDDEGLALEGIKVLLQEAPVPIVFFVDELESLFISMGQEAELQFLESIKRLVNEVPNFVLVLSCITSLWDRILELSSTAFQSRLEPPVVLKRFTRQDLAQYAALILQKFWTSVNLEPEAQNPYWPLDNADIEASYAYSHGNPREAIKYLQNRLEEKKLDMLKEFIHQDNSYRTKIEFAREIANRIKQTFPNLNLGVFTQKSSIFVLLAREHLRLLMVIPPDAAASKKEITETWAQVEDALDRQLYQKVLLIHPSQKVLSLQPPTLENDQRILIMNDKNVDSVIDSLLQFFQSS